MATPPASVRPGPVLAARSDAITGWAMVSPSVVLIALFGLLPVVWAFLLSFQHNDLQTPGTGPGSTTTAS